MHQAGAVGCRPWGQHWVLSSPSSWVPRGFNAVLPPDTEYISAEELSKVDKMLSHLSEESKQAAATTLVSVLHSHPHTQLCCSKLACSPGTAAPQLQVPSCPPQPTSEEDLCPICYAHPISAIFRPCSHKSCK